MKCTVWIGRLQKMNRFLPVQRKGRFDGSKEYMHVGKKKSYLLSASGILKSYTTSICFPLSTFIKSNEYGWKGGLSAAAADCEYGEPERRGYRDGRHTITHQHLRTEQTCQ